LLVFVKFIYMNIHPSPTGTLDWQAWTWQH
jgi:hypothetical protein